MSFSRTLASEARWQDKILGFLVLLALGLCFYLVLHQTYFQSQKQHWVKLNAHMSETFGVVPGTLIEISGVTIGNVESLELDANARVSLVILIDDQYAHFLRTDSTLEVKSQLGVDAVLSGTGLELIPGAMDVLLGSGDSITIREPKSLDQIMQELKIEEMAAQVQTIVDNVSHLTSGLAAQQNVMTDTLHNLNQFSGQLVVIGEQVPDLLQTMDKTLLSVEFTLNSLDKQIENLVGPTQQLVNSGNDLLQVSSSTLETLEPTFEALPSLMLTTQQMLLSVDRLTRQLSRHWLLGSGAHEIQEHKPILIPDIDLYEVGAGSE